VHSDAVLVEAVRREGIVGNRVDGRIFTGMRSLTWRQVYARRIEASQLARRAQRSELAAVLRATCGVHAQLPTGTELALSARVGGVTREEVRDLLWERRELAKASTLRGTLHVHPADELALWSSLGETRGRWREQSWLDWQGLTLAEAEELREAVLAVLDDGRPMTRGEVGDAVGGRFGVRIAADSWGHFLLPASDLICHGPPRGRNVTFVRCDRWLAAWQPVAPEAALLEICRRYLEAYGPARRDELEHWLAMPVSDAALAGFEEVDVEGYRTFVVPGTPFPEPESNAGSVRLLWHYDVYVIGCHPRDRLIPEQRERVFLRGAGPAPTLLVDGRVAGVWTRKTRGKLQEIRVEPFARLTAAQLRELADDAARVARTYGSRADLQLV
jgi:hypothetical protein